MTNPKLSGIYFQNKSKSPAKTAVSFKDKTVTYNEFDVLTAKLGAYLVDVMDATIEFSPIDKVADAMVLLSGTPDSFTVIPCRKLSQNTLWLLY